MLYKYYKPPIGFPGGSVVVNPPANTGDMGLIPGWGRSPGDRNGDPLQCSCLGNLMGRGAWRATVHGVTKSRKRLDVLLRPNSFYSSTVAESSFLMQRTLIIWEREQLNIPVNANIEA